MHENYFADQQFKMFRLQPKIVGQSLASHVDESWDMFSLQIIETSGVFGPSSGRVFMPHCKITIVGMGHKLSS